MRVLIYTHNTSGLGHASRACAIAGAVKQAIPMADVLCVGGVDLSQTGWLPPQVEYVKLPSYGRRLLEGVEVTRAERLSLTKGELLLIRRAILRALLETYDPDVCIVDFFPQGKLCELMPMLKDWKSRSGKLLCFGLRAFVDAPEAAFTTTLTPDDVDVLEQLYDTIWVYTDPAIVDVATIYPELEPLRNKLLYTGYVLRESTRTQQSRAEIRQRLGVSDDTWLVVVGLGSGWKAEPLLELVIAAARVITEHHHARFLVLCGTKLDREMVFRSLRAMEDMPVFFPITFAPNPADYMVAADAFIGRGGYNTLAEVLLTGVPALIVPSRAMGDEQELHARRLADLGLCLRLDETGLTPDVLAKQVLTLSMRDGFNQPRYRLDGAQFAAAWLSRTRRIVGA